MEFPREGQKINQQRLIRRGTAKTISKIRKDKAQKKYGKIQNITSCSPQQSKLKKKQYYNLFGN